MLYTPANSNLKLKELCYKEPCTCKTKTSEPQLTKIHKHETRLETTTAHNNKPHVNAD